MDQKQGYISHLYGYSLSNYTSKYSLWTKELNRDVFVHTRLLLLLAIKSQYQLQTKSYLNQTS